MNAIQITDPHLEINKLFDFKKYIDRKVADIAILSGDIHEGVGALDIVFHLLELGYIVIYVPGNHEYYGHDIDDVNGQWQNIANSLDNFYFLHNEVVTVQGVNFIGTPLWTDIGEPNVKKEIDFFDRNIARRSGDFYDIKKFKPEDMRGRHFEAVQFLEKSLSRSTPHKNIVITHYLPSYRSVAKRFKNVRSTILYASELNHLVKKYQPSLWFHGHTHDDCDYYEGDTRVFCKPIGYQFDANKFCLQNMIVELT